MSSGSCLLLVIRDEELEEGLFILEEAVSKIAVVQCVRGEKSFSCRTGNYINGKWVWSRNGKTIASINPARSHEVVGEVPDSDCEDLNEAVTAAQNAFAMWSGMLPVERGAFTAKSGGNPGKTVGRHRRYSDQGNGQNSSGNKGRSFARCRRLRYFAQEGLRQMGELLPSPDRKNFLFSKRVPWVSSG